MTMVSGVLRELGWDGSRLPMQISLQSLSGKFLWDMETHNWEGRLLLTSRLISYLFSLLGHSEGAL